MFKSNAVPYHILLVLMNSLCSYLSMKMALLTKMSNNKMYLIVPSSNTTFSV
jgi:hypothetical protein